MPPKFDAYHTWLGIPPEDQPPNHYRLLGLTLFESNPTVIENAGDQRMAHLRTFQAAKHAVSSQKLLNGVSAAKLCLLNSDTKAPYDEQLRRDLAPVTGPPVTNLATPPPPRTPQPPPRTPPQAPPPQPPRESINISSPAAAGRSHAAGKPRSGPPVGLIGAAVAGVALLAALVAWAMMSGGSASGGAMLVVDWSGIRGERVELRIDRKSVDVRTSNGPTEVRCKPGKHQIVATRPGFEAYIETVTLEPGQSRRIVPVWARQSHLIFMMSEDDRSGMQLEIDGTKHDVSSPAPEDTSPTHLRVAIDAGPHKVLILRPGYEPFQERVNVVKGKDERIYPPSKAIEVEPTQPDVAQPGITQPDITQPDTVVDPSGIRPDGPAEVKTRLPKPSSDTIKSLAAQIDRQYPAAEATTDASKLALSEKLFEAAQEERGSTEQGSADKRFVLLSKATGLASAASDRRRTFELIDGIAAEFDVDALKVKARMLPGLAHRATDSRKFRSFVFGTQQVLDRVLAGHRGDLVVDEIQSKLKYGGPFQEQFHKQVDQRLAAADRLATQWGEFRKGLATLETDATDSDATDSDATADANLVAGRWHCFREEDWPRGLPLLAKGSDAELQSLARQEQTNPPTKAEARTELAEGWWRRAEADSDPTAKAAMARHAAGWYAKANESAGSLPFNDESYALKDRIKAGLETAEKVTRADLGRTAMAPPEGEPFPPGVWFDLLESVDVVRHGTRGQWVREGDGIKAVEPFSRLALPATIEKAYDLQVDFTRLSGDDAVGIIFPVGLTQDNSTQGNSTLCSLILSGWHGAASGLQMIAGRNAQQNSTMPPVTLMNGRRYSALITVRPTLDRVEIDVRIHSDSPDSDPPTEMHWSGERSKLGIARDWNLPSLNRPGLGATDANVVFHLARVRIHEEEDARGMLVAQDGSTAESHIFTPYFGAETGTAFQDVGPRDDGPADSYLAGFRFVLSDRIEGVRAVYRTGNGEVDGRQFGNSGNPNHSVVAKDGYAVGRIVGPLTPTAEGMRVVFMRRVDDRLDPNDRYESDWIGRSDGEPKISLGSGSAPVVGIHGAWEGNALSALGLIFSGKRPSVERNGRSKFVSLTGLKPRSAKAAGKGLTVNQAPVASWPMVPENPTFCNEYLPAQAPSSIGYGIPKNRKSFSAVAYCVATPSVRFGVLVDGETLFESDKGGVIPIRIDLPPGSKKIELVVDPLNNTKEGRSYWLLPRLHGMDASKIGQLDGRAAHDKLTQQAPLSGKSQPNTPLNNARPIHLLEPHPCTEFLFAPAPSRLTYDVPPGKKRFSAVGYCVQNAKVKYRVLADETKTLYESDPSRPAAIVSINVVLPRGCKTITLVVEPLATGVPGRSFWCYPRFTQ